MTLALFLFKYACEWTRCFSKQYTNHCKHCIFLIVVHQVSRNIMLAPCSIMISIS